MAINNVAVTKEETNTTISWTESPIVATTLNWGNTTSKVFSQSVIDGTDYSAFLDYLEPSTTYYYEIVATPISGSCYSTGTSSGSWTTQAESNYLGQYGIVIAGFVDDPSGAHAPVNVAVQVTCTNFAGSQDWNVLGFTNSVGHYSLAVGHNGEPKCTFEGFGYFVVEAWDGYNDNWMEHWNETIVVWAPQVVNFYLNQAETTAPTIPIVSEMEFTHTAAAQVSACSSQVSSAEFEADSTASGSLFGISYNVQSSNTAYESFGTSGCILNQGEPGSETWGEVEASGMIVFNAIEGRATSIPWEQYYGGLQNNGNAGAGNATGAPIQDWLQEPTSSGGACTIHGINWLNWPVPANSGILSYGLTASGSVSNVAGQTWGLTVPFDMNGIIVGNFGYSNGVTLTTSESSDFSVNFIIPTSTLAQHFTVACSGGTPSAGTGLVLHVWRDST